MADNKFPWRDIYSVAAWRKILKLTSSHGQSGQLDLSGLTNEIESYHRIKKDVLANVPARRLCLLELARKSLDLILGKEISIDKAGKKKYNDRGGDQYITDIGPWLFSLARRCRKKAEYLGIIEEFEEQDTNAEFSRSAAGFLRYLSKVQRARATDKYMHLTTGNRMERIDPLHRGGAELELFGDNLIKATSNPLSKALVQWLEENSTTPFFLWLENSPICLVSPGLDDEWSTTLRTVKKTFYVPEGQDLYLVMIRAGQLWCEAADARPGTAAQLFDTSKCRLIKGSVATIGRYAFVWSTDNQIYTAPHNAGTLHHSSFTAGYKVKAAGMLGAEEGKVIYVDDDTGHYHTDAFHLYHFCRFLDRHRLLRDDAIVVSRTLPGENKWPIKNLLARYRDAESLKELKAEVKALDVKLPEKGLAAGAGATTAAAAAAAPTAQGQDDTQKMFAKMKAFQPPTRKKDS